MNLSKLIIFIGATTAIIYVSWESLRNSRSHGFYRFFAWEAILALILFNFEYWFNDPFSFLQIISWLLLIISLFLVVHGIRSSDFVRGSGVTHQKALLSLNLR